MTLEEFCEITTLSLRASLADIQSAKNNYESDSIKAFADIRIRQYQEALRYVRNIRRLQNV